MNNIHLLDSFEMGASWLANYGAFSFCLKNESTKKRPWLCKINGRRKDFKGYDREFLNAQRKVSKLDGLEYFIFWWGLTETGVLYEFRNFHCDFDFTQSVEGFFTLRKLHDGKVYVECLTKEQVNDVLINRRKKK